MRKPEPQYPIDAVVQKRLDALERLIDTDYEGSAKVFEAKTGIKMAQVNQWFSGYRALRDKALRRLEEKTRRPQGYFDGQGGFAYPTAPPAVHIAAAPPPPPYAVEDIPIEYLQVLRDLSDLPPPRRSKMIDQIHQAAEEVREAVAFHERTAAKEPVIAAARSDGKRNPRAYLSYGDGNSRQAVLPLTTVADPFTAQPDDREVALYRNISKAPK